MSDRIDFYLGQLVTELDLDTVQANLDQSIRRIMADQIYAGIVSGYEVVEHNPIPNLTVDVAGPGIAYDQTGRRVYLPAPVTVNCATDSSGSSTAVANPGNERWVSLFAQYDEVASNLEIDDNGVPVLRDIAESYRIRVVQGAEAAIGAATRPALLSDGLLIADVRLENGTTQIFDADIESGDSSITTTRFHWTFRLNASAPATVFEGTLPDVLQATLTELNTHITDLGNAHPSTAVEYDPTVLPVPAKFAATAASASVQEAIDGVVSDIELEISRVVADLSTVGTDYTTTGGRSGVMFGYAATATGLTTNVTISAGVALKVIDTTHARTLRMVAAGVVSLAASQDAVNPRWVAIELNATTGALVTTLGTPGVAAAITFPAGVANRIPLCYVYLPATGTNIAQTDLVDCRPLLMDHRHMNDSLSPQLATCSVGGVSASTTTVASFESVHGTWAEGLPFRMAAFTADLSAVSGYWATGETYAGLAGDDAWVKVFIMRAPYPVGYDSDVARTARTFYHTGTRIRGGVSGQVRGGIVIVTEAVNPTYNHAGTPAAALTSNEAVWNGVTSTEGVYLGSLSYLNGIGWVLSTIVGDTTYFATSTYTSRRSVVGDGNSGTTQFRTSDPLNGGPSGHIPSHRCAFLIGVFLISAAANPSNAYLRGAGGTPEYYFRVERPAGSEVTEIADQFWLESSLTLDWNIPATAGGHTLIVWMKAYKDGILSMR